MKTQEQLEREDLQASASVGLYSVIREWQEKYQLTDSEVNYAIASWLATSLVGE